MQFVVYQITNLITGKIYIGCHQTSDLNDNYMGSGKLIKRAIQKHGQQNFLKEILAIFDNPEDMFSYEKKVVNEEFVSRANTYNMKIGGYGGWEKKDCVHAKARSNPEVRERWLNALRINSSKASYREKLSKSLMGRPATFSGRKHSDETIRKMKLSHSGQQTGNKNSQYETCWIYNLIEMRNMKIKRQELDYYLQKGWIKGRKMNLEKTP